MLDPENRDKFATNGASGGGVLLGGATSVTPGGTPSGGGVLVSSCTSRSGSHGGGTAWARWDWNVFGCDVVNVKGVSSLGRVLGVPGGDVGGCVSGMDGARLKLLPSVSDMDGARLERLPSIALELIRPYLADGLVPEAAVGAVTAALCAAYNPLPFHNAFHGVSALHVVTMLTRTVHTTLTEFEKFLLAVAALGHDAGHNGFNNVYEVATKSALSLAYGGEGAVLERFHAATTVAVLDVSGALAKMTLVQRTAAMQLVAAVILTTDMSKHDVVVADLVRAGEAGGGLESLSVPALSGALLHCADLSAHAFPLAISTMWTARISLEFARQAKSEALNGLPVTPFMKNVHFEPSCTSLQVGFLSNIVVPLWRALAKVAGDVLDEPMRNVLDNTAFYTNKYSRNLTQVEAEAREGAGTGTGMGTGKDGGASACCACVNGVSPGESESAPEYWPTPCFAEPSSYISSPSDSSKFSDLPRSPDAAVKSNTALATHAHMQAPAPSVIPLMSKVLNKVLTDALEIGLLT